MTLDYRLLALDQSLQGLMKKKPAVKTFEFASTVIEFAISHQASICFAQQNFLAASSLNKKICAK